MTNSFFSSFVLVAASEMGDKTQLLAFSLAARFKKPWAVMAGILAATILNHALASYSGQWISSFIRPDILGYVLGASFLLFGIWTLRPDSLDSKETKSPASGAFLTTLVLFFFAEMGDKTQLATVALGAQFHNAVLVTLGTTAGMMASDGLAVFAGEKLAEKIRFDILRWIAAGLFFLFGLVAITHSFFLSSQS